MNPTLATYRPDTPPVGGAILANAANTAPAKATPPAKPASSGFGFSDMLAIINPLQHIPVVGTLYREWTGDTISPAARIAGDTLYGGVIGLATSVADTLVEGTTGKDFGTHVYDTLFGDDTPATPTPAPAAGPATAGTSVTRTPGAAIGTTPAMTADGQSSFLAGLQHGGSHKRPIPLTTSAPLPPPPGQQATTNTSLSQAEALASAAQQATNAYGALGSPLPSAAPAQLPVQPTMPNTASSAAPASPVSNPLAATPPAGISTMMLQALDKYNAMAKQNRISGNTVSLTN